MPLSNKKGSGDRAAQMAAKHHDSLFRFALSLTRRDQEEALDIVQQTYMEVLEGRADLASARNPKAFMLGIVRRVAASHHRRKSIWARILRLELSAKLALAPRATPLDDVAHEQLTNRIHRAMTDLPARQLEVASLVFLEDLTVEDAAKVMGVSVGTARTHYHRAKKRLSELLEEDNAAN